MIATVKEITEIYRECDNKFLLTGGSTRHFVRDLFLPSLEDAGFIIIKVSEAPKKIEIDQFEVKKVIAHDLRSKGYSYRQIQRALGYKSVRSISHLLNHGRENES